MDEESLLAVRTETREAFALCLALGTLEAIRAGVWPPESGIWTIGPPGFWRVLETVDMPEEVLAVFRRADEWDALLKLAGGAHVQRGLDRDIAILKARLASLPDPTWRARWVASQAIAESE